MTCANLRFIERQREFYDNPRSARLDRLYNLTGYMSSYLVPITCGKCAACLRSRQSDLAARCVQQAKLSGSMQFLTLTYDEQHLPLSMVLESVDKSTGEVNIVEPLKLVTRQDTVRVAGVVKSVDVISSEFDEFVRDTLSSMRKDRPRYVYSTIYDCEEYVLRAVVTPSLNPRDVRLWLKSARVKYEREFGTKLPDFKYVVCGEMGTHTHRPHYHICFFGLSNHDVRWLAHYWNYGFTYLRTVKAFNQDGTSGFEIAARYVSKYMTKGEFECESVRCGYAYKSRLMSSKHLGGTVPKQWISYFRGYDVLGEYDINEVQSDGFISKLAGIIQLRFTFCIGGKNFRLPNSFIKQIWYVQGVSQSGVKTYKPSVVRTQVCSFVLANFFRDRVSEYIKNNPGISAREASSLLLRQEWLQKSCISFENERGMQSYKAFYLKSKF